MKPVTTYAQFMLTAQAERYGKVVEALPGEALNWRPGDETTNAVPPKSCGMSMRGCRCCSASRSVTAHCRLIRTRDKRRHFSTPSATTPRPKRELLGIIATGMAKANDLLSKIDEDRPQPRDRANGATAPAILLRRPHHRPRGGTSRPRRTDQAVVATARSYRLSNLGAGTGDDTVPAHGREERVVQPPQEPQGGQPALPEYGRRRAAQPPYAAYSAVPPYGYYDTPAYEYTPGQAPPASQTSSFAIASLVCSLASWLVIPFVGAVAAVILGHIARREIRRSYGLKSGNGLAMAGLGNRVHPDRPLHRAAVRLPPPISRLRFRVPHVVGGHRSRGISNR